MELKIGAMILGCDLDGGRKWQEMVLMMTTTAMMYNVRFDFLEWISRCKDAGCRITYMVFWSLSIDSSILSSTKRNSCVHSILVFEKEG